MQRTVCWLLAIVLFSVSAVRAAEPDAAKVKFFESKIRPVLIDQCYECHATEAKKVRGGLLVDSRDALLKGGDSGPAIVPGKPDESLLFAALKYEDFEMPPKGKLGDEVIRNFEQWIRDGAMDPRTGPAAAATKAIDIETGRKFWAFQPVANPRLPEVADSRWAGCGVDRFIEAKRREAGLEAAAPADRATLIRRATFDLWGLPPRPEDIASFVNDPGTDDEAFARVIDRLLASPHLGERFGRHWLDVARYSDTTGGGRSMFFSAAWRYRDYVINSFNKDKPFDRFVVEQIAGDLLTYDDCSQGEDQLTATAFLVLGPTNYEEQDKEQLRMDVIDEQIDTTGRAFMGMTIGCARCHDHKFDPIPTRDYYAMVGIFRSTQTLIHDNVSTWVKRPVPLPPEQQSIIDAHAQELAAVQKRIAALEPELKKLRSSKFVVAADKPHIVEDPMSLPGVVVDEAAAEVTGDWTSSGFLKSYVGAGYIHDARMSRGEKKVTYRADLPKSGVYDVRIAYNFSESRATNAPVRIIHRDGETLVRVNQTQQPDVDGLFHSVGRYTFTNDVAGIVTISNDGVSDGYVIADAVWFFPVTDGAPVKNGETADAASEPAGDVVTAVAKLERMETEHQKLTKALDKLKKDAPPAAPQVLSIQNEAKMGDYSVCIRGNVHQLGETVPRSFLQVAMRGEAPKIPENSSGRLELAQWLADSDNPLTARVYVNRVWQKLFGEGIVRSVDNFGVPGDRPTHPELLDHLASEFMADGWSTKRLIRRLMLSQTYRMQSERSEKAKVADPENKWLASQNRKRLDAEAFRDAMQMVSGTLDFTMWGDMIRAGTKTEYGYEFDEGRRSVYLPVLRNRLPDTFSAFDFPDPNLSTGKRATSTLPTQALYLMNSDFVRSMSATTAGWVVRSKSTDDERLSVLYETALGRQPSADERYASMAFLKDAGKSLTVERAWTDLVQAVFSCVDFRYVD
jgi:cytochrome c553